MTLRLERSSSTRLIVTFVASTRASGIVDPAATQEGSGGMAEMTIQRGLNMVDMLTRGCHTMAGRAIVDDTSMIKHCADKGASRMTYTTILSGGNMRIGFTRGETRVMTRGTIVHDSGMIKDRR